MQSKYILDMYEIFNKQKYYFIKATWKYYLILGNNNYEKNNKNICHLEFKWTMENTSLKM